MEMIVDKEKLKELRESKAWSQSHLAEVSGISLRTIQRIEKSGIASPESVKSLCATFGIQIADLVDNKEKMEVDAPLGAGLLKFKISRIDKKATLVSFILAFIIAFVLTQ